MCVYFYIEALQKLNGFRENVCQRLMVAKDLEVKEEAPETDNQTEVNYNSKSNPLKPVQQTDRLLPQPESQLPEEDREAIGDAGATANDSKRKHPCVSRATGFVVNRRKPGR